MWVCVYVVFIGMYVFKRMKGVGCDLVTLGKVY